MLHFETEDSVALIELGILALDEDGQQVLSGLTASETRFMFSFDTEQADANSGEAFLYHQLRERFIAARAEAHRSSAELTVQFLLPLVCARDGAIRPQA